MQRIGRNIISLGLSRISSGVILFLVQAKLAEFLGPHGFGKFSLVLAFLTIFLLFVDSGISRYVVKKVSGDKSLAPIYYGNFLVAQLFLAVFVFSLFVFIPRILHYDAEINRAMLFAGAGLLLTALTIPSLAIIQAWQKIHLFATVIFFESLIKAGWFIYAILKAKDLVFIFSVYLLIGIFDIIVYWLVTRPIVLPRFAIDRKMIRTMLMFGIPFAMISGFEILIAKIDVVIQKVFLQYSEVGLYAAAYRFLDFLTFLPAIVAISLFPYFAARRQDLNNPETQNVAAKINRYLLALAVPLGIAVTILADQIILTLFGPSFKGSVLPFQILIWSTVITLVYAVANVIMQVKLIRKAVIILGLGTALNVAANWLLVPHYGILASAWITVVSYILVAALYIFYSRKVLSFPYLRHLGKPLLAAAVMAGAIWPLRGLNIFLVAALATVIYFAILILTRFFTREDWKFLKSIFQRQPTL